MSSSEARMPRDPDAGTGEAPDPETCPATSSSGCSSSVEEKEARLPEVKKEGWNEWNDNTWEQTLKLRYLLTLAAKPDFVPPARFQQAMETCMKCLLHAPQGQLMQPARLLQLLDSPEAGPLLRTWLEEALKEGPGSDPRSRTVLVPQRVCSALCSWPAERSLLQQSAAALWEVLNLGLTVQHFAEQLDRGLCGISCCSITAYKPNPKAQPSQWTKL
eukprot:s936_g1.t1